MHLSLHAMSTTLSKNCNCGTPRAALLLLFCWCVVGGAVGSVVGGVVVFVAVFVGCVVVVVQCSWWCVVE